MARKNRRLGKLPPRYRFALNPFPEVRWSKCPRCERLTFSRKFPLLIHMEEYGPVVLGKTCRYCARCEFIIAHQEELEAELAYLFSQMAPEVVGNDYFVMSVVERKTWQKGRQEVVNWEELLQHAADIKQYYTLNDPRPRWVPSSPEPPA
jgi:hypothetical protein